MVKRRQGFVSNSSSSSFIISVSDITAKQLGKILNPDYRTQGFHSDGRSGNDYQWRITLNQDEGVVAGYTFMDNFAMDTYFEYLGIDTTLATWED